MGLFDKLLGKTKVNIADMPLDEKLMEVVQAYIGENYEEPLADPHDADDESGDGRDYADVMNREVCILEYDNGIFKQGRLERAISISDVDRMMFGYAKGNSAFGDALLRHIEAQGKSYAAVYNKARVSKKDFAPIISEEKRIPEKPVAVALAVALELSTMEAQRFINKAGYLLERSSIADLVVEFFIGIRNYDVDQINRVLYEMGEPMIGSQEV